VAYALIENASYQILSFSYLMSINLIITYPIFITYLPIQGCSSVAVDMKADLVASPVGLHSFVSSEGNSDYV
jgi:hypothetical protein